MRTAGRRPDEEMQTTRTIRPATAADSAAQPQEGPRLATPRSSGPESRKHRRAEIGEEDSSAGHPEQLIPGHHEICRRVQQQGVARTRTRSARPTSTATRNQPPVRMPSGQQATPSDKRNQPDREESLPVIVGTEVIGRTAESRRAEQLKSVQGFQVIALGTLIACGGVVVAQ